MSVPAAITGYAFILLFALAPVGSVLLTAALAKACGCRVDEGSAHPCKCCGVDIGGLLYAGGVTGWLALVTLPLGGLAAALWTFAVLASGFAWLFAAG